MDEWLDYDHGAFLHIGNRIVWADKVVGEWLVRDSFDTVLAGPFETKEAAMLAAELMFE